MFIIELSILLFYIANAAQPETSVQLQKLDYTSYHLIVNQSKILYENPNCFQIFLWKRTIQDKNRYMYQDEDYDVIVQEENKILGIPGCSAMQKAFPITQHIKLYLPSNDKIFYTDLIVLDNRALIIRNDLTLQEVHISENLFTKTAKQQKLNIQTSKQTHPIFLWDQNIKRVYIISESGGVSIPDWISIGEPTFFINQEKFKQRNIIYDAFLKNNKIYVASGAEGLDVYKYQNGAILHENVILRIDNQHLTAMDVSGDDQNLYILDHNYGLYVCDYEFNLKFKVPVLKGSDFGHYKNTFFIIAESITRQDYALEVFLNFTDNTFYFNHYYLDEMSFYDVKVYENYAVLIGYEAHKIISHSVFSGFIKFSSDNYFEMSQLMQMKQWNNSFVGLGKRELRLMTIKEEPAHIWCQSQQMFQEHYLVAYYLQNKTNPFDAKLYKQVFQLVVDDVALLTKANLILLALFLIIIFIIVLISAAAIILYRYYKNKTDKLEEDKKILTQQASIDKEEGPGQELSAL